MASPPSSPPPYTALSTPSSSPSSSPSLSSSSTTTTNSHTNNNTNLRVRGSTTTTPTGGGFLGGKPKWLLAIYVLFGLVCVNAVLTYQRQKRLIEASLRNGLTDDDEIEEFSSTGAEEHVISANYGSSMYGGGIHTSRSQSKKKKKDTTKVVLSVSPKPSDGSKDLNRKRRDRRTDFHAFSIYIMTDTPQTDWQEKRLRSQMADLRDYVKDVPSRNITFGVHLGDTQRPSNTLCAETAYDRISALIAKGPRPTLVVPGNNDWYDCPRRNESWTNFMKYYGPTYIEEQWHSEHYTLLNITRSKDHPELFALYYQGVLFIGINLLDARAGQESKAEWDNRLHMDKEWVATNVEWYFTNREVRGVVVFGHGKRSARTKPFFTSMSKYFVNVATREKIPVMYMHGDGLTYKVDQEFSHDVGWEYYYDIQVHQSGLADPILLDIAPQRAGDTIGLEEENNKHAIFGNGLFRIDQRQGVYADPMDIQ